MAIYDPNQNVAAGPGTPGYTYENGVLTSVGGKPVGAVGPAIPPPPKAIEPTTLSSTNVTDKYIPDYKKRLNLLTGGGAYTGIDGNNYAADGSPLQEEKSRVNGTSVLADDPAQNKLLTEMMRNLDASTAASLSAVNQQASALRSKQERINKSAENATEQALLLGGSSRYSVSSSGIAQAQKSYGLEQIAQIDAEERQAISKAEEAQRQGKYQIMGQALQIAETRRREKQAVAEKMLQQQTKELDRAEQATRDNSIADLVGQGIDNPGDLLNMLNYDEAGNLIGDFTAQEIGDTLKLLTTTGKAKDLPADVETFNYLKDNGMLPVGITKLDPSQQYFAFVNANKLAESGKLGQAGALYGGGTAAGTSGGNYVGKGAGNQTEEQVVRMRLFAKLSTILNKGALSDSDREVINNNIATLRAAGMSEQEIMSSLAGFPTDVKTPYNSDFVQLVAGNTDTNEQQQTLMAKVGQLLSSGNYTSALNTVEGQAMKKAKELDPDNYMGHATASNYLKNIDDVRSALAEGGVTGFVPGGLQNVLGRIKGPKTATLKANITNLVAQFRKDLLGSAVTESEKEFLSDLIPDISSSNFIEQLNAFQNGVMNRYNSTRSSVSLPEVNVLQAIKPQERLKLYENTPAASEEDFWGGSGTTGGMQIYDPNQGYVIPK